MKKIVRILSLLFALILSTVSFAHAEIPDISGLSYDELIALHKQIGLAIMQSDEWKEVTIYPGVYVVGTEIPAGDYTVTYANDNVVAWLHIYDSIQEYEADHAGMKNYVILSETYGTVIGKLSLSDGQVISFEYGPMIFTPYMGLGF